MEKRDFLNILEEQIRSKRARPMIIKEIEAHIEDQKRDFMADGMAEKEAEEAAVLEMGDPVEAGVALDRIHRPRMEWSVLAGVIFISILGLMLQYTVMMTAYPSKLSWAAVLSDDLIGKRMIFTLAGIILMLLICWMDYTVFNKYAVLLWILLNLLLILCVMKSPLINGRPYYLTHVSCLIIPFYAGILYHFRGQGIKGIIKSMGCLCIPFAIMAFYYMLSFVIILGFVGLILIHFAIYKKWFGERRPVLYLELWCLIILAALTFLGFLTIYSGGRILAEYQIARIDAWLHPGKYEVDNFFINAAAEAGESVRERDFFLTVNMANEIKSSYLWIFLFKYLGTGKGIVLTVLVLGFWLFLFYTVKRQKNQFGHMISLGCVLFLSIQTVMYMGMNFGIIPFTSMTYMPFISSGEAFLLISYFYMGILLSVCSNSRIVEY